MSEETDKPICGAPYSNSEGICDTEVENPDDRCSDHDHRDEEREFEYMSRSGYYQSQPEQDQKWIDSVSRDLVEKSYFTMDDDSVVEKLRQVAIDMHQRRRADEYIAKNSLTQQKTVGFHEDHGEIKQEEENVLMVTKDRLSRESRITMSKFGCLDQETGGNSDEAKSLIEQLSNE